MSSVMVEEARSMVMKQAGSIAAMTQATMASMSSATAEGASMMAATMTGGSGTAETAVAPICSNTCDKVCIPLLSTCYWYAGMSDEVFQRDAVPGVSLE